MNRANFLKLLLTKGLLSANEVRAIEDVDGGTEFKNIDQLVLDQMFNEVKFTSDSDQTGTFHGYGAYFGNIDSHGDMIVPGAFNDSLLRRKSEGRGIPMHLMHRFGGDGLPIGVWTNVSEDEKGLKVEGKISGMDTERGRHLYALVKDGALGGLSIGYRIPKGGASYGQKAGDPKRTLKTIDLREISLVDDPSNAMTRVAEIKSILGTSEKDKPATEREFERHLRDECGFTNSEARIIAERGFKHFLARDESSGEKATNETKQVLDELAAYLKSLNK